MTTFQEYFWYLEEDDHIVVGINDDALDELQDILKIILPNEDEELEEEQTCGQIYGSESEISLSSPCNGVVIEINEAVIKTPSLINEDPMGEAWLFKIQEC